MSRLSWGVVAAALWLAQASVPAQPLRSVTLAWDPSPSADVVDYAVYSRTNHGGHVISRGSRGATQLTVHGLHPGQTYYFTATALSSSGLESDPTPELRYTAPPLDETNPPVAVLRLTTEGRGNVNPNLAGQQLLVDQSYTITAIADPGYVFLGWTGSVNSNSPTLTFVMQAGLTLKAHFVVDHVPEGVAAAVGQYTGLFAQEDQFRPERAGAFSLMTNSRRTCSGKLQLGPRRYSFTGSLDASGLNVSTTARSGTNLLGLELRFAESGDPDEVVGRVATPAWQVPLRGHRAVFGLRTNVAPFAGRYTVVIAGQDTPLLGPEGDGIGAVKVDALGRVTLSGTLADGTKLTHHAVLSKRGQWPLYIPLYAGQGSLLSWLSVTNAMPNSVTGALRWTKPASASTRQYPGGFTNQTRVVGSVYLPPASPTHHIVNLTQTEIVFAGGNLAVPLTNAIALSPRNKIVNMSPNKLAVDLSASVGLFSGRVVDPDTGRWLNFRGALLQDGNCGYGFLLGTNRSSRVLFGL